VKTTVKALLTQVTILASFALESKTPDWLSMTNVTLMVLMEDIFIGCIFNNKELVLKLHTWLGQSAVIFLFFQMKLAALSLLRNSKTFPADVVICFDFRFEVLRPCYNVLVARVTVDNVLPAHVVFP